MRGVEAVTQAPAMKERPLGRVAVLGLGLIGGSLARAITGLDLAERVTGWSPQSTERDAALTSGALAFAASDWRHAVSDAHLVLIAAPLRATCRLLADLNGVMSDDATVSDVAGLKVPVAEAASEAGLASMWVGSHPMAGGERSGFWASRADLFENARVWTVALEAPPERVALVERLWSAIGATPQAIGAEEHDRLMALVSHLPQLLANALADVQEQQGIRAAQLGPGGEDMTRLAESNPEVWIELLEHAGPTLPGGLRGVARSADRLADLLEAGDLESVARVMSRTRAWKQRS